MFGKNGRSNIQVQTQRPFHYRRLATGSAELLYSSLIFNLAHSVARVRKHITN